MDTVKQLQNKSALACPFNDALFENPGKDYRGVPFWAWNCKLRPEVLLEQIDAFREMGFGGFDIHSRKGLDVAYLGPEFMECVKICVEKAKETDMSVWLYDEDRWPSGCAGGIVTADRRYRQKNLRFTQSRLSAVSKEEGIREGQRYCLGSFDLKLDGNGYMVDYVYYCNDCGSWKVYVETAEDSPRYNGAANLDVMSKMAVDAFIQSTYQRYLEQIGDDFGQRVKAIFTDEPQVIRKQPLPFASPCGGETGCAVFPWTTDFDETYTAAYGESILPKLAELVWDLSDGRISETRYRYHNHVADRFGEAYTDNIGDWCRKNGIAFTGHLLQEETLNSQTMVTGDVMRAYPAFDIPGIDVLLGGYEYTTAKQVQSVVHQLGKRDMCSELYGVTNWDTDFRDYLEQGNWQACLGVTVRVPHLAWVSMKGEGKRDYPACIGMQAPWYKEFRMIEDHFARIHTVTRNGKPIVRVGVIHPIESYWLYYGPNDTSAAYRKGLEEEFQSVCRWLLFGLTDFDFINEALLPRYFHESDTGFCVGEMCYDVIIVPGCRTLRSTTCELLDRFAKQGGNVIFLGDRPNLVDAKPDSRAKNISGQQVAFSKAAVLEALKPYRQIELYKQNGEAADEYICQERQIGKSRWLLIVKAVHTADKQNAKKNSLILKVCGKYKPTIYDTNHGTSVGMKYEPDGNKTVVPLELYSYDSVLIRLDEYEMGTGNCEEWNSLCGRNHSTRSPSLITKKPLAMNDLTVRREEPNVVLLDRAEYCVDGNVFAEEAEILKIDTWCRKRFAMPPITGKIAKQPWCIQEEHPKTVILRYRIYSEGETACCIAFEECNRLCLNGESIDLAAKGYYVDRDIHTSGEIYLQPGENILEAEMTISEKVGLEPMYLLGDFDVSLYGTRKMITSGKQKPGFGSVTAQGMPFYGGNLIYSMDVQTPAGAWEIEVSHYCGAMLKVYLDGQEKGNIVCPPYKLTIADVAEGAHQLSVRLYGNRHNTFGSLHSSVQDLYCGPQHWYKEGSDRSEEYCLKDFGIMKEIKVTVL